MNFREISDRNIDREHFSEPESRTLDSDETFKVKRAQEYWDDFFEEAAEELETNEIDNEALLGEIFGRNEEEFKFDFEINEELQAVLSKFEDSNWQSLTEMDKKLVIQEFATALSESLMLEETPYIRYFDGPENELGAYCEWNNTININERLLDSPVELVDTAAHEMRHAYQHQRAMKPETYMDLLYKCNFENYISPVPLSNGKYLFFTDYQDQLIEVEARAFAKLFGGMEAEC